MGKRARKTAMRTRCWMKRNGNVRFECFCVRSSALRLPLSRLRRARVAFARALVDSHFTLEHGRRAFVGGRGDWRKHLSSNGAFVSPCVRIDRSSISILLGSLAALSSLLVSSSHRFIIIIVYLPLNSSTFFTSFTKRRLEDFLQAETSFRKSPSRRRVEDCR